MYTSLYAILALSQSHQDIQCAWDHSMTTRGTSCPCVLSHQESENTGATPEIDLERIHGPFTDWLYMVSDERREASDERNCWF